MSDEFEAFLRSGMAERVGAAPTVQDHDLAGAAIAGAGRIRRRRRVASAASGAGLLVLGAAAFVWQPWIAPGDASDGVIAGDTSTTEAQRELDMEFVVQDDGVFDVINQDGDRIALGDQEPTGVYRLANTYLAENSSHVWTVDLDGTGSVTFDKPSADEPSAEQTPEDEAMGEETYLRVNEAAEQFAMITLNQDGREDYTLLDAADPGHAAPVSFTVSWDLSLTDWTERTAVFTADLTGTVGDDPGFYHFDEQSQWGLDSLAVAGFDAVAVADAADPNFVCVADLEPGVGILTPGEQCGPSDSAAVTDYLETSSNGDSINPVSVSENVRAWQDQGLFSMDNADLGEYEDRFYEAENWWSDPLGRWQMTGNTGDRTLMLLEATETRPTLSELAPPAGFLMPVLSYT